MKDGLYLTKPLHGCGERKVIVKNGMARLVGCTEKFRVDFFFEVNIVIKLLSEPE